MKNKLINIFLILALVAGLSLLLYPTISDYWNSLHASQAVASYDQAVKSMDEGKYDELLQRAGQYNRDLFLRGSLFALTDEEREDYNSQLDIDGSGVMGYIEIPTIKVSLPIYHGTSDDVLQVAVGHLEWSSLPVGGESTHCVLSGHRGLPSAKLFTNLDQLAEGDLFVIRTLDEVLTYEVDRILIVLPSEVQALAAEEGKDLCTLVTCTPFGVNTHRLLIRGHRIAYTPKDEESPTTEPAETSEPVDSTWEQEYEKGVYFAIGVVVIICLVLFLGWLMQRGESRAS